MTNTNSHDNNKSNQGITQLSKRKFGHSSRRLNGTRSGRNGNRSHKDYTITLRRRRRTSRRRNSSNPLRRSTRKMSPNGIIIKQSLRTRRHGSTNRRRTRSNNSRQFTRGNTTRTNRLTNKNKNIKLNRHGSTQNSTVTNSTNPNTTNRSNINRSRRRGNRQLILYSRTGDTPSNRGRLRRTGNSTPNRNTLNSNTQLDTGNLNFTRSGMSNHHGASRQSNNDRRTRAPRGLGPAGTKICPVIAGVYTTFTNYTRRPTVLAHAYNNITRYDNSLHSGKQRLRKGMGTSWEGNESKTVDRRIYAGAISAYNCPIRAANGTILSALRRHSSAHTFTHSSGSHPITIASRRHTTVLRTTDHTPSTNTVVVCSVMDVHRRTALSHLTSLYSRRPVVTGTP